MESQHTKYLVGILALAGLSALMGSLMYYMNNALEAYAAIAGEPPVILRVPATTPTPTKP